jgi:hypothetical protein
MRSPTIVQRTGCPLKQMPHNQTGKSTSSHEPSSARLLQCVFILLDVQAGLLTRRSCGRLQLHSALWLTSEAMPHNQTRESTSSHEPLSARLLHLVFSLLEVQAGRQSGSRQAIM